MLYLSLHRNYCW